MLQRDSQPAQRGRSHGGSPERKPGYATAFFVLCELIYHAAVRALRKEHGNAVKGLLLNVSQTLALVAVFYAANIFFGFGGGGIRGDFMLYIMTGIFLFICHVKAMMAVVQSEGPTSAMMKHAPMNTYVAIGASALSTLYMQLLSMIVVLFLYHTLWQPIVLEDPLGFVSMMLLSWASGVGIGLVFLAIKPWAPTGVRMTAQLLSRVNMFASGKMFVANLLPGFMLPYFTWNPLFHVIDQARGFAFINYIPRNTNVEYPLLLTLILLILGLMGEAYTRKQASLSWGTRG